MNKKQKRMIDQAFATSDCKVKKLTKRELIDKLAHISAKLEDVLMLEGKKTI